MISSVSLSKLRLKVSFLSEYSHIKRLNQLNFRNATKDIWPKLVCRKGLVSGLSKFSILQYPSESLMWTTPILSTQSEVLIYFSFISFFLISQNQVALYSITHYPPYNQRSSLYPPHLLCSNFNLQTKDSSQNPRCCCTGVFTWNLAHFSATTGPDDAVFKICARRKQV